jgi:hypothetical protein
MKISYLKGIALDSQETRKDEANRGVTPENDTRNRRQEAQKSARIS